MDTMTEPDVNKRVAIIGAGLIGCSWAALFMKHGWDVTVWDRNPDIYENVADKVARALEDLDNLHDPKSETGSFALCDDLAYRDFRCGLCARKCFRKSQRETCAVCRT